MRMFIEYYVNALFLEFSNQAGRVGNELAVP